MIDSFSQFYYGTNVDRNSRFLNFDEGSGELSAEIPVTSYTLSELATAVQSALNSAGVDTYTVTVDRASRTFTISSDGTFSLLVSSGSQVGQSIFSLIGFTGADRATAASHTGDSSSGSVYKPQFKLQSYVDKDIFQQGVSTVVNKTTEGAVETVTFGTERFYEMDIKFITDLPMDGKVIRNNPQGLADAIAFMQDISEKNRFEFMPDENDADTFSKVILESAPGFSQGTGFKLRELFNQNLRDIYETGILKMRVVV